MHVIKCSSVYYSCMAQLVLIFFSTDIAWSTDMKITLTGCMLLVHQKQMFQVYKKKNQTSTYTQSKKVSSRLPLLDITLVIKKKRKV